VNRQAWSRRGSNVGALLLLVVAVFFALAIGPGRAHAAGGTYRIIAGGDLDWFPDSGFIDQTSSDPISKTDTLVGSLGAVGQAHYEVQAGPGVVRTKLEGSVDIPGGLFYPFNPSTQATSSTELTVSGPPGFVNVSINLHVDGILGIPVCTGNNPNCGAFSVAASAGIFVVRSEFDTVNLARQNDLGLAFDPVPGGYHVHGDVTLPPFGIPANTPVAIPILVNLGGRFGASATFGGTFDDPAIQYQVSFPVSGPVLNVPPGYTVSGPNVTDNHWTDPFASGVVVTDCADPALASLASVSGNLVFRNIANCPEISLPQLKEVHGDLIIEGNSGLGHVGFTGPVLVDGSVRIVDNSGTGTDVDLGNTSAGGDLDISGNTGSTVINAGGGQISGDATIVDNGSAVINISDITTIGGSLTLETTGDLSGTTGGGANDVTLLGGTAALHALLPQGAFDHTVGFAITRHTDPPQDGEAADGSPAVIGPIFGYRFAFDVPTLNSDAALTFTVDMSQLDAAERADLLNALGSGLATIVGKGDDPGAEYRAFPVCTGSQTPAADGCVAIAFLDANGNPTTGNPAFVRFDGVVGHFSSYGVAIVTPTAADETPPTITATATSNGNSYTSGMWTNHDVVVHYECTDDGSGVASVSGDETVSGEGDGQSRTGTCTDNAGNDASATFDGIRIDKTPPTVSPNAPASGAVYAQAQVVQASFSCSDGLSGYSSCSGTVPSGTPIDTSNGPHSFTVTAVDNAGNTASTTVQYVAAGRFGSTPGCNGYFNGTAKDVLVVKGTVCHLLPGTTVSHDLTVQPGGALIAGGIAVGHDLTLTGAAASSICASSVSHDLTVKGAAGPILVGDTAGGCSAGNTVGHDLVVEGNSAPVDVGDNSAGHDVKVQDNRPGGATVNRNSSGHDTTCQGNNPQTGKGNNAVHSNSCPA
jgi:hypothetical protein